MVFFACEGEESEGTQLNKGRFRARSTTTGLVGDTNGSEMPKIKTPKTRGKPRDPQDQKRKSPRGDGSQPSKPTEIPKNDHPPGWSTYSADPYAKNPQES